MKELWGGKRQLRVGKDRINQNRTDKKATISVPRLGLTTEIVF